MEHRINPSLLRGRVRIHLVGAGGNGAQMAHCLARLDIALRALGHPAGLHVTAYDADRVSEANVGRQVYSVSDIGQNKAVLTVHRLNQFYGLFSTGLLRQHGVVVNLDAKRCGPIDVDPAVWKRFGVRRRRPRGLSEN